MLLHLDFSLDTPIYQQIRNQIVLKLASGELPPGERLPPIRTLAEDCGVNMMTVSKAYTLLKQEGYLAADRRAGTVVRPQPPKGLQARTQERLKLAVAEARAGGVDLQTVLDICRMCYRTEGFE